MPEPHNRRRPLRDRLLPHGADRPPPEPATPVSRRRTWTPDQVRALGMTTDLETAASILGIGRTLAYDLARDGDFPVPLLRLGRRVLVPVAALLAYLGHPEDEPRAQT
jgi:predicted DNA-binding transcriptional regulator AlpA